MAAFLDQAGGLWARGALNGKVGAAFTSSATQHGGNETTLFSIITNLLHFGMTIVGLPYSHAAPDDLEEITGGAPYGANTIAGGEGSRQPARSNWPAPATRASWLDRTAAKLTALSLVGRESFRFGTLAPAGTSGSFPLRRHPPPSADGKGPQRSVRSSPKDRPHRPAGSSPRSRPVFVLPPLRPRESANNPTRKHYLRRCFLPSWRDGFERAGRFEAAPPLSREGG